MSVALRVIPVDQLVPDPDVQHDWTYRPKFVRRLATNWKSDLCGVIDVVPLREKDGKMIYGVVVGRHRADGARGAGVKELRCDVHEGLDVRAKAELKLRKDRDTRKVTVIESFLDAVKAGDQGAIEVKEVCESYAYEVKRTVKGEPYNALQPVGALLRMNKVGHLRRVLELNTLWYDLPGANTSRWLKGLHVFVAEGFDGSLTAKQKDRLRKVNPVKVTMEAAMLSNANGHGDVQTLIAAKLRKTARIQLPKPPAETLSV